MEYVAKKTPVGRGFLPPFSRLAAWIGRVEGERHLRPTTRPTEICQKRWHFVRFHCN